MDIWNSSVRTIHSNINPTLPDTDVGVPRKALYLSGYDEE